MRSLQIQCIYACTEIKQFKAKSNADYLKQIHIICKDKYTTFDDNVDIKMQYVELISIDGNYEYFPWTHIDIIHGQTT